MSVLKYPIDEENEYDMYVTFIAFKMSPIEIAAYSAGMYDAGGQEGSLDGVVNQAKELNMEDPTIISLALPSSSLSESFDHSWSVDNATDKALGAVSSLSGALGKALSLAKGIGAPLGVIAPPVYTATYSASSTRSYNFRFSFIPQNKNESDAMVNIIQKFKYWSSPKMTFVQLWDIIPFVVKLQFIQGAKKLNDIIKPKLCIINNVTSTYFDNGQITAYKDGIPKSTSLSISLKEVSLPTREDFQS